MSISEQRSELMRSVATETGRKKKPVSFWQGALYSQDRIMPRPVADLIADYIPAAQCLKGNKVLLLQPFQYGQRLALEPGTEPLGQLLEGADPFARVDGIADAVDAAV